MLPQKGMVLTTALLLMATLGGPAAAKINCKRTCRSEIKACTSAAKTTAGCKSLHGKSRADCNKTLRAAVKSCKVNALAACNASGGTTCQ